MAKGSTMKLDGYPRTCATCGLPVVLSGPVSLWFECVAGVQRSFHFTCRRRVA